eukprot:403346695
MSFEQQNKANLATGKHKDLKTSITQPVIDQTTNALGANTGMNTGAGFGGVGAGFGGMGLTEKVQPQPYPLQGQALATGWGQYPQGAYYPPPVQKPVGLEKTGQMEQTTGMVLHEQDCIYCNMPPNLPRLQASTECGICSGVGYQYMNNNWSECVDCRKTFGGAIPVRGMEIPEVYSTLPGTFPKYESNPSCSLCYGTGYKYQKKQKDWRVCEYCVRESGTPLTMFQGTNLIADTQLYSTAPVMGMVVPTNLPHIKSAPNCTICHGQGYEWKYSYWAPCDRCIKKFGNMMVCRYCVGTGFKLKDGTKCKCLKHHLHKAKPAATTPVDRAVIY